ncbi:MAG TPA: NUDIX domain-containing protein [Jatrophihabitans sp.]|nr:NUDIX domain-containing protein [Jatrophihabitans sp.]
MEILAAAGIVFDDSGRLLLIRRARPPGQGLWSIPGGKCLPGESAESACVRELHEETGLRTYVLRWVGRVSRPAPGGHTYIIDDFTCALEPEAGVATAGDDADEVGWFSAAALSELPLVTGLREALGEWQLLPDPPAATSSADP